MEDFTSWMDDYLVHARLTAETEAEVVEALLEDGSEGAERLRLLGEYYGPPSAASRAKIEAERVVLVAGGEEAGLPGGKPAVKLILAFAALVDMDEMQAARVFLRFLDAHYAKEVDFDELESPRTLERLRAYHFSQRLYNLRSLAHLLRVAEDDRHPHNDLVVAAVQRLLAGGLHRRVLRLLAPVAPAAPAQAPFRLSEHLDYGRTLDEAFGAVHRRATQEQRHLEAGLLLDALLLLHVACSRGELVEFLDILEERRFFAVEGAALGRDALPARAKSDLAAKAALGALEALQIWRLGRDDLGEHPLLEGMEGRSMPRELDELRQKILRLGAEAPATGEATAAAGPIAIVQLGFGLFLSLAKRHQDIGLEVGDHDRMLCVAGNEAGAFEYLEKLLDALEIEQSAAPRADDRGNASEITLEQQFVQVVDPILPPASHSQCSETGVLPGDVPVVLDASMIHAASLLREMLTAIFDVFYRSPGFGAELRLAPDASDANGELLHQLVQKVYRNRAPLCRDFWAEGDGSPEDASVLRSSQEGGDPAKEVLAAAKLLFPLRCPPLLQMLASMSADAQTAQESFLCLAELDSYAHLTELRTGDSGKDLRLPGALLLEDGAVSLPEGSFGVPLDPAGGAAGRSAAPYAWAARYSGWCVLVQRLSRVARGAAVDPAASLLAINGAQLFYQVFRFDATLGESLTRHLGLARCAAFLHSLGLPPARIAACRAAGMTLPVLFRDPDAAFRTCNVHLAPSEIATVTHRCRAYEAFQDADYLDETQALARLLVGLLVTSLAQRWWAAATAAFQSLSTLLREPTDWCPAILTALFERREPQSLVQQLRSALMGQFSQDLLQAGLGLGARFARTLLAPPPRKDLRALFDQLDADGSSRVDRRALAEGLQRLAGQRISAAALSQLYACVDPRGLGRVDYEGFLSLARLNHGDLAAPISGPGAEELRSLTTRLLGGAFDQASAPMVTKELEFAEEWVEFAAEAIAGGGRRAELALRILGGLLESGHSSLNGTSATGGGKNHLATDSTISFRVSLSHRLLADDRLRQGLLEGATALPRASLARATPLHPSAPRFLGDLLPLQHRTRLHPLLHAGAEALLPLAFDAGLRLGGGEGSGAAEEGVTLEALGILEILLKSEKKTATAEWLLRPGSPGSSPTWLLLLASLLGYPGEAIAVRAARVVARAVGCLPGEKVIEALGLENVGPFSDALANVLETEGGEEAKVAVMQLLKSFLRAEPALITLLMRGGHAGALGPLQGAVLSVLEDSSALLARQPMLCFELFEFVKLLFDESETAKVGSSALVLAQEENFWKCITDILWVPLPDDAVLRRLSGAGGDEKSGDEKIDDGSSEESSLESAPVPGEAAEFTIMDVICHCYRVAAQACALHVLAAERHGALQRRIFTLWELGRTADELGMTAGDHRVVFLVGEEKMPYLEGLEVVAEAEKQQQKANGGNGASEITFDFWLLHPHSNARLHVPLRLPPTASGEDLLAKFRAAPSAAPFLALLPTLQLVLFSDPRTSASVAEKFVQELLKRAAEDDVYLTWMKSFLQFRLDASVLAAAEKLSRHRGIFLQQFFRDPATNGQVGLRFGRSYLWDTDLLAARLGVGPEARPVLRSVVLANVEWSLADARGALIAAWRVFMEVCVLGARNAQLTDAGSTERAGLPVQASSLLITEDRLGESPLLGPQESGPMSPMHLQSEFTGDIRSYTLARYCAKVLGSGGGAGWEAPGAEMAALLASMLHHGLHEVKTKTQEPGLSRLEPRRNSKIFKSAGEILRLVSQSCNRLLGPAHPAPNGAAIRLRLHLLTAALLLTKAEASKKAMPGSLSQVVSSPRPRRSPSPTRRSARHRRADAPLDGTTLMEHALVALEVARSPPPSAIPAHTHQLAGVALGLLLALPPAMTPQTRVLPTLFAALAHWGRFLQEALERSQHPTDMAQGRLRPGPAAPGSQLREAQLVHSSAAAALAKCCAEADTAIRMLREGHVGGLLEDPVLNAWRAAVLAAPPQPPSKKEKFASPLYTPPASRGGWAQLGYLHTLLRALAALMYSARGHDLPTIDTLLAFLHAYQPLFEEPLRPRASRVPPPEDLETLLLLAGLWAEGSRYGYSFISGLSRGLREYLKRFGARMRELRKLLDAAEGNGRRGGILTFSSDTVDRAPKLAEITQRRVERLLCLWDAAKGRMGVQ